ncbi:MAG: pilus assembly protein PilC [Candidatus Hydrogenedentota bacterium]|nr:MAG: pilus assembly protein PilC [Candidatus Hydrogenedentota bacterium]
MPTFAYVAKGRDGSMKKGTLAVQNRKVLQETLKKRGLTVDTKSITEKGKGLKNLTGRKVKAKELLIFTRQLATMINSGLPLLQCLDILAEQTEDQTFAGIIDKIGSNVEGGETLSDALREYKRAFPELYVSMVRAGEASGELDNVLIQLADYLEASEDLKRRVRGAMVYPVVSLFIIMLISSGLILFVVPQFQKIFEEMGATLPAPTMLLITISETLRSWKALVVVGAVIAGVMGLKVYNETESGNYNIDRFKLKMPVFGMLLRKVAVSRFTRTLSTLIRSGVPILQALEIVESTAGSAVFGKVIRDAAEAVRNGETLAEPLGRSGEFPPMVTRMISVGEKTGALETMLEKIADFYDSEVEALVDNLTSMLEPILLVVMGIVVGGIIIGLFMPIMNLSTIVN